MRICSPFLDLAFTIKKDRYIFKILKLDLRVCGFANYFKAGENSQKHVDILMYAPPGLLNKCSFDYVFSLKDEMGKPYKVWFSVTASRYFSIDVAEYSAEPFYSTSEIFNQSRELADAYYKRGLSDFTVEVDDQVSSRTSSKNLPNHNRRRNPVTNSKLRICNTLLRSRYTRNFMDAEILKQAINNNANARNKFSSACFTKRNQLVSNILGFDVAGYLAAADNTSFNTRMTWPKKGIAKEKLFKVSLHLPISNTFVLYSNLEKLKKQCSRLYKKLIRGANSWDSDIFCLDKSISSYFNPQQKKKSWPSQLKGKALATFIQEGLCLWATRFHADFFPPALT